MPSKIPECFAFNQHIHLIHLFACGVFKVDGFVEDGTKTLFNKAG